MPFRLTNASTIFMRLMNHILRAFIRKFIVVYLDEYLHYLRVVFDILRHEKLYANTKRCSFCMNKVVFLGFVVSANSVKVDEEKIKPIQE